MGQDGRALLAAEDHRLPCEHVLRLVRVAGRHAREPGLGDPAEHVAPVDQLPAVDERRERSPVGGEASGRARSLPGGGRCIGMRRDQRGAVVARGAEGALDAVGDACE